MIEQCMYSFTFKSCSMIYYAPQLLMFDFGRHGIANYRWPEDLFHLFFAIVERGMI
jgi:hypothetical protein